MSLIIVLEIGHKLGLYVASEVYVFVIASCLLLGAVFEFIDGVGEFLLGYFEIFHGHLRH